MKRFVKDILLFILVCTLTLALWVYMNYVPRNDFLGLNRSKHLRLERMPSPRIILVGGSNLLLGMESAALEKQFPRFHAVNMSLTMALGSEFQIHDIERDIRPGDVIVVSLEYENVVNAAFNQVTGVYTLEAIEQHPPSMKALTTNQWRTVITQSLLEYCGIVLRESRFHLRNLWSPPRPRAQLQLQAGYNEYGDAVFQRHAIPKIDRKLESRFPNKLKDSNLNSTVTLLNGLEEICAARGARCFLTYPPYPASLYEKHGEFLNEVDRELKAKCRLPILSSPDSMVLPDSYFLDTPYHLLGGGAGIRTQRLMDQLKPHLTTPSNVELKP